MSDRDSVLKSFLGLSQEQSIQDYQPEEVEQTEEDTTQEDTPASSTETSATEQTTEQSAETNTQPTETSTTTTQEQPVTTTEPKPEEKVQWTPEFKTDTDRWAYEKILAGDEEEVYNALHAKYAYKSMSEDDKILAYLSATKPGLDKDDIAYVAAQDFGIDATPIDEETATTEELSAIRNQKIQRKEALAKANEYFENNAHKLVLPTLPNPLDADEDYKQYKSDKETYEKQSKEQQEGIVNLHQQIDAAAPNITAIETPVKVNIDDSELALGINFTLDGKRQQELAQYAKGYSPTEAEVAPYRKPDGTFDMKGYMQMLAQRHFSAQILAAGIKQAIAKDREQFVEGTLKNGTLRNNEVSQPITTEVDPVSAYWNQRNGTTVR